MIRISLGLVWLLLAVIVISLIILRRWMKKKAAQSDPDYHPHASHNSAPVETSDSSHPNQ